MIKITIILFFLKISAIKSLPRSDRYDNDYSDRDSPIVEVQNNPSSGRSFSNLLFGYNRGGDNIRSLGSTNFGMEAQFDNEHEEERSSRSDSGNNSGRKGPKSKRKVQKKSAKVKNQLKTKRSQNSKSKISSPFRPMGPTNQSKVKLGQIPTNRLRTFKNLFEKAGIDRVSAMKIGTEEDGEHVDLAMEVMGSVVKGGFFE